MKPKNPEVADIWIGYILGTLYEHFPMPQSFDAEEMIKNTGEKPASGAPDEFLFYLAIWLRDEGYIKANEIELDTSGIEQLTLTERSLRVLRSVPNALQNKVTVGDKLAQESKRLGQEGAKKAVGELVGHIIGGIISSVSK